MKRENFVRNTAFATTGVFFGIAAGYLLIPFWKRYRLLMKRRRRRFQVRLPSSIELDDTSIEAEILDLNCSGAKVRYWADLQTESLKKVDVLIDDSVITSDVMWANNQYMGVRFTTPLKIRQVRRLAGRATYDALGRLRDAK